jgi:hypothetical protein
MKRDLQAILHELGRLTSADFEPDPMGMDQLEQLARDIRTLARPVEAIPALLAVVERLRDTDLGSPGPIVHTIEAIGGYHDLLAESVARQPTPLSLWMINRILNSETDHAKRHRWISALETAATCEHLESAASARSFLEHQRQRSRR